MNDYYQNSAISQSAIKVFLNSKEEYHYVCVQGNRTESKASFFEFGKLYHTMFLEPDKFKSDYVVTPPKPSYIPTGSMKLFVEELAIADNTEDAYKKSGYSKYTIEKVLQNYREDPNLEVYKDYYRRLLDCIGRKVVSNEDYLKVTKMIEKLNSYQVVQEIQDYLTNPYQDVDVLIEFEIFFTIEGLDLNLKAKPDLIIINHTLKTVNIYDLKSTKAKTYTDFIFSIKNFGYNIQNSFYLYACKREFQKYSDYTYDFLFIPQCTEEPYRFLGLLRLDEQSLVYSEQQWTTALHSMNECYKTNVWSDVDYNKVITISILDE
jgi:hypothetical protein